MKQLDKKFLLFGIGYFCLFCAYTTAQVIKESIFAHTVGLSYINYARLVSVGILIPFVLLYNLLVDRMKKVSLVALVFVSYASLQIIYSLFLTHATIGLTNTQHDAWRLFGWGFFFLIECLAPFTLSVFWAYLNSTTGPEQAKTNYGLISSFGALGGIVSAGSAWLYLSNQLNASASQSAYMHQLLSFGSAILMLITAFIIFYLKHETPDRLLQSYAVRIGATSETKEAPSILHGARILVKTPYVFGIFAMVFLYEMTSMIIAFLKLKAIKGFSSNLCEVTTLLFKVTCITQIIGFFFALIGTRTLMRFFGERFCLLFIPSCISVAFAFMLLDQFSFLSVIVGFIIIRALNYSFIRPVKEALYIPTSVDVRYKAKSWIDTIGTKLAKGTGSACNIAVGSLTGSPLLLGFFAVFAAISGGWFMVASFLGNTYQKTIKEKKIIG